MTQSVYATSDVSEEARRYFDEFGYPNEISTKVLGDNLQGLTVADIGAGPSVLLGRHLKAQGAKYVAVDLQEGALEHHRNEGFEVLRADMGDPLPKDALQDVDIAHVRFMLRHMYPLRRTIAINQVLSIAKRCVFVELDFDTWNGGPLTHGFKDAMVLAFRESMFPEAGNSLLKEVHLALEPRIGMSTRLQELRFRRFARPRGVSYYKSELIQLSQMVARLARERADQALIRQDTARELEMFAADIKEESTRNNPEPYTPPDLVVVEVEVSGQ
jgi:hypothetical protein